MAITKLSGRQCVEVATADFTFADVTDDTYIAAVDIPLNAIVVGGHLAVNTLFNSGTDDKFSIGDQVGAATATKTTYAALSADITAVGLAAAIVPTGYKYGEASTVGVVWNGSGTAMTAGVGRLTVMYIIDGKAETSYGV